MRSKKKALTPEEKLSQALLPREEWPYELPKGWVWTRVESIAIKISDGSHNPPPNSFSGIPLLSAANVYDNKIHFDETNRWITEKQWVEENKRTNIEKNDVLLTIVGTMGRTAVVDSTAKFALQRSVAVIKPKLDAVYLSYYLSSPFVQIFMLNNANGTAQKGFYLNKVAKIKCPLPPLPEQQRIVGKIESLFAKLDEAGDRLQKVLDGYEARRAAILHEAFSGKWTGDHGAGDMSVPKGWRKVKLSDVCTINPKKLDTSSLEDSLEVSFIPMASVDEVLGEVTKPDVRNLGKVKKGFTNFQEGDVVFAKITPCMENGKSAVIGPLLNDIGYGTTEFYVLRCHPELYNRFLYHLVRSIKFRSEAKSQMTGAVGQQRVPKNFMADYEILLPPLNEQIQIVQMVDTFFKKEYEVRKMSQNVIEQISLLKKSILARAFRGELGTQDSSDPSALELLKECVLAGKEVSKS